MKPITRRGAISAAAAALSGVAAARAIEDGEAAVTSVDTDRTKFAVNVEMWWRDRPFLERLQAAADHGFSAVEFWPWRGKDLDGIARACEELGLAVGQFTAWGFSPGLNDPANHAAFVKEIVESCAVAHKLGAKCMTVVAGNDRAGVSREEMLEQVVVGLKRAAGIAEREDVTLILEPMNGRVDHPGHCLYGSADAIAICKEVNSSHVKINWDLYHMQIEEGDLCGHLREGIDWIGYLQLADHPGRNEPGTGEIQYSRVLREAWDLGYRGFVGLECTPKGSEADAVKGVVRASRW